MSGMKVEVSLISSGSAPGNDSEPVISPSGLDIFFITEQGLLPQDTDGLYDIYDARAGGGFPVAPAPPRPCEGDACQGPLTNPAPLMVPGSVSQAAGENLVSPAPVSKAKTKVESGRVWQGQGARPRQVHQAEAEA